MRFFFILTGQIVYWHRDKTNKLRPTFLINVFKRFLFLPYFNVLNVFLITPKNIFTFMQSSPLLQKYKKNNPETNHGNVRICRRRNRPVHQPVCRTTPSENHQTGAATTCPPQDSGLAEVPHPLPMTHPGLRLIFSWVLSLVVSSLFVLPPRDATAPRDARSSTATPDK